MDRYDVIVCGGGTAGAAAAIKSARLGAKTLVIEQLSALGGTQAMGWVTPMMPNYLGDEHLSGGLNLEVMEEHARLSPGSDFPKAQVWYNPVALAVALGRLAEKAGVVCLFDAFLHGAQVKDGLIENVSVHTKGGERSFSARVFVDASGDADLAHLAGAPTESGGEDGRTQPLTLRFNVANVDIERVAKFFGESGTPPRPSPFRSAKRRGEAHFLHVGFAEAKESPIGDLVREAVGEGTLEEDDLGYFQFFTMLGRPRELAFNCPRLTGFDPLDPFSRSDALVEGRERIVRIHAFCKKSLAGFEDSYVCVVAPLLGVRESRRIAGRYVLTEEDHQQCRKFSDVVARNRYPIDIHLSEGGVELRNLPEGDYHEIPYRSLLPQGIENLLAAGRCISATFAAQ
ncbi:MAG: FAD-dependent oxidoreductase, partial [Armatimonadetes bacterium]|nr:FAD-dependent oxidoreductase [Armatimonadota bacterium]